MRKGTRSQSAETGPDSERMEKKMAQDRPGDKPADLDLERIVAAEQIGEEVCEAVPMPNYAFERDRAMSASAGSDARPSVLQASFNTTASVPDYIRGTLAQLNGIYKFMHGLDLQRLQRDQVMKLTEELFAYQYKDMQHVLLLGMDVQKKTRFVQYLEATKSLQNRIQRGSADAQLAVIATMFGSWTDAFKAQNKRDAELDQMAKGGIISRKQYEMSKLENQQQTNDHIQRLKRTADMLIATHSEFLYKTLELFKTKLIESGGL